MTGEMQNANVSTSSSRMLSASPLEASPTQKNNSSRVSRELTALTLVALPGLSSGSGNSSGTRWKRLAGTGRSLGLSTGNGRDD